MAVEEALPGHGRGLGEYKALFVETVAQPLLCALGLDAEALQQVVAGDKALVAGEAEWTGFSC
ncbi:hypothetical protein [Noviherbaspirillum soli]|uniref:hypothetical protein n=1 Tax=Noviherbaspirillum soli TaxID=1064518 RepID=UPI00188C5125|nr:hypothetical protein [Noviherbaspirillum soli]